MDFYFDEWIVYTLLKDHIQWLRLILKRCRQVQLSLNIKKCILQLPLEYYWVALFQETELLIWQNKGNSIFETPN